MTYARRVLGILRLMLIALAARPLAQSATVNRELLKDWIDMKATMMKLADAMPADKYGFKSTPAQRDFGQQVLHVATANVTELRGLGGKAVAPVILGPSTRARVIYFLLGHSWDIYGQMVVYLRVNGGVPPASQRP